MDDGKVLVNFRLSRADARRLKAVAAMIGDTQQEIFEQAARQYLAAHASIDAITTQAGMKAARAKA